MATERSTFSFTWVQGPSGTLEKEYRIKAKTERLAAEQMTKRVGKLGLHGIRIFDHATLGRGTWFVVCNGGVNATFKVVQIA